MQDRALGEQLAKVGIYLIFSLSLFAFLMFVHGARKYDAAGAAVEPDAVASAPAVQGSEPLPSEPAAGEAPADRSAPAVQDTAEPDPAPMADAEAAPEMTAEDAAGLKYSEKFEELPAAPAIVPGVYGRQVDMASLQAELDRMAAMGFSFSGDLSANYVGEFYATSYCAEAYPHICGGNGVTASGTAPIPGLTVASDWSVLPPGTWIYISGVGIRRVEDSGSAIKGARLDVVLATHGEALAWRGQGNHEVWILA